jgi:hypothetical protein
MAQIIRPLLALLSLVALWFLAMVLEALGVSAWAMAMIGGLLLVNVVVLIAMIHRVTLEQDGRDGKGGLPPHHPDVPQSGGGDQLGWWPELERELAEYLADQEQNDRQPQPAAVS